MSLSDCLCACLSYLDLQVLFYVMVLVVMQYLKILVLFDDVPIEESILGLLVFLIACMLKLKLPTYVNFSTVGFLRRSGLSKLLVEDTWFTMVRSELGMLDLVLNRLPSGLSLYIFSIAFNGVSTERLLGVSGPACSIGEDDSKMAIECRYWGFSHWLSLNYFWYGGMMTCGNVFCALNPIHSILQSGDFTKPKTYVLFTLIALIVLGPLFLMLHFRRQGHEGFVENWLRLTRKLGRQTIFVLLGVATLLLILYSLFDDLNDPNGYAGQIVCHGH